MHGVRAAQLLSSFYIFDKNDLLIDGTVCTIYLNFVLTYCQNAHLQKSVFFK